MSETTASDSSIAVLQTSDGSQIAAVVDDEARLTVEDALSITTLENEATPPERLRYGRTYWMENVGPRVGLGAAGLRGVVAEVIVDTGRQRPVRALHRIGRTALGTGRLQKQASTRG